MTKTSKVLLTISFTEVASFTIRNRNQFAYDPRSCLPTTRHTSNVMPSLSISARRLWSFPGERVEIPRTSRRIQVFSSWGLVYVTHPFISGTLEGKWCTKSSIQVATAASTDDTLLGIYLTPLRVRCHKVEDMCGSGRMAAIR
jgi:hypothetical protein